MLLAILAALSSPVMGAALTFTDLCPGAIDVQRSKTDIRWVEVYCVGDSKPRLVLEDCPKPAVINTDANGDKTIKCPTDGLPVIIRTR